MTKQYISHRSLLFVKILAIVVVIFPFFFAVAEKKPEFVGSEESKSRSLASALNLHIHDLLAHAPQDPEHL